MTKLSPEEVHVQVAHQERFQLRKQIRLLKRHKQGMHREDPLRTCNACLAVLPALKPNALPQAETTEVTKNATA